MADEEKEVEFYSAAVNAWFGTRLEHDRSLLTLSAGGVGLLVTLLSTVGIHSVESLILYIVALISFLICLSVVLCIFKRNAAYLQAVINGSNDSDPLLGILDTAAISSFVLGALLSSIIGVAIAVHSI